MNYIFFYYGEYIKKFLALLFEYGQCNKIIYVSLNVIGIDFFYLK
jgi:hypothetical protein